MAPSLLLKVKLSKQRSNMLKVLNGIVATSLPTSSMSKRHPKLFSRMLLSSSSTRNSQVSNQSSPSSKLAPNSKSLFLLWRRMRSRKHSPLSFSTRSATGSKSASLNHLASVTTARTRCRISLSLLVATSSPKSSASQSRTLLLTCSAAAKK